MKNLLSIASILLLAFTSSPSTAASFEELFGDSLVNQKGEPVDTSTLDGKLVGVYFSAQWCPPCRAFTPSLVQLAKSEKNDFQVVFVSSDRSEEDQFKYMKEYKMDWPTVRHGAPEVQKLRRAFSVSGIPKLVILSPEGNVITENGRGEMGKNANQAFREWQKQANL